MQIEHGSGCEGDMGHLKFNRHSCRHQRDLTKTQHFVFVGPSYTTYLVTGNLSASEQRWHREGFGKCSN